jgi:hypothetical protein
MPTGNNQPGGSAMARQEADFFSLKGRSLPTKQKIETEVVRMENQRKVTTRQLAYIQQLRKKQGNDSPEMEEELSFQEASALISGKNLLNRGQPFQRRGDNGL